MADDEQFSLCWNNFNTNLSAGFHESLCREDLVDVSLAAEGHIVKAHRLVLSVCSPFFRKMFTQMPTNAHAFVFLNNVSHSALKDLIQFMYCGEVNVKQDALPAFISTAESLQIKGLTDNDPPQQPPQEPTPPPPPAAPQVQQQQQLPAQRVQRQQQARSTARYKIETVDDGRDDKGTTQIVIQTAAPPQATIVQQQQQQQTQHIQTQQLQSATTTTATLVSTNKRSAQRNSQGGTGAVKRSKTSTTTANVIDPLESQTETTATTTQHIPQQITVQTTVVQSSDTAVQHGRQQQQAATPQEEAEYIDLPMDIPTKSEPDYSEEHAEVAGDGDTAYVEDDAYGDMRYDDSYFTENEDAAAQPTTNTSTSVAATTSKAVVKQQSQSYSDSSFVDTGDQGNTEAQAIATVATKTTATSTLKSELSPVRKRGRPKTKVDDAVPKLKLLDRLKAATNNIAASKPAVYASTTKGGVKLVYEGHLFKFSFRKAEFSVFQCCFRKPGEDCKVRVVCDQRNVFPFDGEHVHFMQASDKSVTSAQFMPGESVPVVESKVEVEVDNADEGAEFFEIHEIDEPETGLDAPATAAAPEAENLRLSPTLSAGETIDPNDFREKIKRRLQKALKNKIK